MTTVAGASPQFSYQPWAASWPRHGSMEEQKPWIAKGPSGIAVRSLIEFVRGWKS